MNSQRGAAIIPAYGKVDMTEAVVGDCLREQEIVHVIVVDNRGDFPDVGRRGVEVLRPATNLGWASGTNLGMEAAQRGGWAWMCALNNDTTLSPGFFDGLRAALARHPADLVAPCYDGHVGTQNAFYRGDAGTFIPKAREAKAAIIDGTCYALTARLLDSLGHLDAKNFGRRGWGAIEDYVLRVRALGGDAVVTERAYLQHAGSATAHEVMSSYERYAMAEMRLGMRRKYGPDWRRHFDLPGGPDVIRVRLADTLREVEDRLRLSETRIGRR